MSEFGQAHEVDRLAFTYPVPEQLDESLNQRPIEDLCRFEFERHMQGVWPSQPIVDLRWNPDTRAYRNPVTQVRWEDWQAAWAKCVLAESGKREEKALKILFFVFVGGVGAGWVVSYLILSGVMR